jgi:putative transposase
LVKLGFKNFYVYTAVQPKTGAHFSLLLPLVDTQCMNLFLLEMSKHLGAKKPMIVMDQASWHRSKALKIPENMKILLLPPYSPELNPVERLWEHAKSKLIKNKIYDTLDDLEDSVCEFFRTLKNESVQSICGFNYLN